MKQNVFINDEARLVPNPFTIEELLAELGVGLQQVAVERNRKLVLKKDYATTQLEAEDRLEIVTFVGGG